MSTNHRLTKPHTRRRKPNVRRARGIESLESRLALSADLVSAGFLQTVGGPASAIYSSSGPYDSSGGGTITDAAGNRYVTINGTFDHVIDLDPGPAIIPATIDAGVVKFDPSGAVAWTAALNATTVARVTAAVDSNQNVYLAGDFWGTMDIDPGPGVVNITSTSGGADYGFYLAKLNSAGQLQWVRTLAANELTPYRIAVDAAGDVVVACNFSAVPSDPPMDVDAGPDQVLLQEKGTNDMVVLKYSTGGNFVWARQIGNLGSDLSTNSPIIAVDQKGDVLVGGRFTGSLDLDPTAGSQIVTNNDANNDAFIVRLNSSGAFVWGYAVEGTGSSGFRDINVAADGSIIVAGYYSGTVDLQPGAGSLELTWNFNNGLVLKLNGDSSVAWAHQFGGIGSTFAADAALDQDGNIYLGGRFGLGAAPVETSDFDPGPGVYELIRPSNNETAYVLSLTGAGDFRWAVPLGGNNGRSIVQGVSVAPNGDVQVSGAFRKTADFDPDPAAEFLLTSSADQSVFVATLAQVEPDPGAPVVDAGGPQTIFVNGVANLDGTVTDDGLPGPLVTTWSLQSGPGTVTFGDASAVDTTASFSAIGNYLLKLEAYDGQFTTADYVSITVNPLTASLTATADTYIDGKKTTANYGAGASLTVNGNPDNAALLKWDLSGIPAGSTLQSATLSINVTGTSANTYEIYELKRSWTETQATWNKSNSATNWQSAGAQGSLDRGSTVLGTVTATATGIRTVSLNAAGLAIVQGWVNNPATNFGFIIQDYANTNKDDLAFSSREVTTAAQRPQLQIVYTPPSAAPMMQSPSLAGGVPQALATETTAPITLAGKKSASVASTTVPVGEASNLLLVAGRARRLTSDSVDSVMTDLSADELAATSSDSLDDELLAALAGV